MLLDLRCGSQVRDAHEVIRRRFIHLEELEVDPQLELLDRWDRHRRSFYFDLFDLSVGYDALVGTIRVTRGDSSALTTAGRGVVQDWTNGEADCLPWGDDVYDVTRCVVLTENKGLYGALLWIAAWWVETRTHARHLCGVVRKDLCHAHSTLMRTGFEEIEAPKQVVSFDVPGQPIPVAPLHLRLRETIVQRRLAFEYTMAKLRDNGVSFPWFERLALGKVA